MTPLLASVTNLSNNDYRNKKKHLHDDLNLAMGNLINYFNQFQKYYVSVPFTLAQSFQSLCCSWSDFKFSPDGLLVQLPG